MRDITGVFRRGCQRVTGFVLDAARCVLPLGATGHIWTKEEEVCYRSTTATDVFRQRNAQ